MSHTPSSLVLFTAQKRGACLIPSPPPTGDPGLREAGQQPGDHTALKTGLESRLGSVLGQVVDKQNWRWGFLGSWLMAEGTQKAAGGKGEAGGGKGRGWAARWAQQESSLSLVLGKL